MTLAIRPTIFSFILSSIVTRTLAQGGSWSPIIDFPLIPVAAYIIPEYPESHRMMVYSAYNTDTFEGAFGTHGYTQFVEIDFNTMIKSPRQVSETGHDMFCPGMSTLADGRLVVTGGSNAEKTSFFDPVTDTFAPGPNMQIARGYQSSTILSNGKIFTIGGSWSGARGGKTGEIYDPTTNTWSLLPGAAVEPMQTVDDNDSKGIFSGDNHAWLHAWRNGSVLQAGPSKAMNWYFTDGRGAVSPAGFRDPDNAAMCGVNIMYDVGKIFSAGGHNNYGYGPAIKVAHLITIDQVGAPPTVERLPDMINARGFANGVVLPDGKILITGGQRLAQPFTDTQAVFAAEIFDPVTKTFTELASAAMPRNYHSVSLLLGDGTVFTGGGGLCQYNGSNTIPVNCHNNIDHPNGEIFTPPYLLTGAARPSITYLASAITRAGGELRLTLGDSAEGVAFSLIRIGSVTHSVNTDQRRIPLVPESSNGSEVVLRLPGDPGIVLPGSWFLFAVSAQGVPSIAKTVMVQL